MKSFRKVQLGQRLEPFFKDRNLETVLGWFVANEGRRPVVVVGAGFTRNARDKRTGRPADVPLWKDVIAQLAGDLGTETGRYDDLTLAELYKEELGTNTLHNKLLDLVPDNHLVPGPAHDALFAYDAEAIVTTNQLDTVLDKGPSRRLRVVLDADLALYSRHEDCKQIIYFHGHRSNLDSWVFTRSEYEDIFKTRPLITTRVRQLLTQYPVLVVGYSLADPDFHTIYRQISLDMANRHPVGLVILVTEPHPAERRHWEALGLRLAVVTGSPSEAFESLFACDPNGLLPDSEDVVVALSKIEDFRARCAYVQDLWAEDERRQRAGLPGPYMQLERYEFWNSCIAAKLPRAPSSRAPRAAVEVQTGGAPSHSGYSADLLEPQRLPGDRFPRTRSFIDLIERFLDKSPALQMDLARWLEIGHEQGVHYFAGIREEMYLGLISWLWSELAQRPTRTDATFEAAKNAIRKCYRIASLYSLELEEIRSDAASVGLDTPAERVDETVDHADGPEDLAAALRKAFALAMDGEWERAATAYAEAVACARRAGNPLAEWAARTGQLDFLHDTAGTDDSGSVRSERKRLRKALTDIEREPSVARWIANADALVRDAERANLKLLQHERRERVLGATTLVIGGPHSRLWRSFRDLESLCAPPSLQAKYLQPILDGGVLPAGQELAFRLKFNVKGTPDWIRLKSVESGGAVEATSIERDVADIAGRTVNEPAHRTGWIAWLKCLPRALLTLRATDLERVPLLLKGCRDKLGTWSRHSDGESNLCSDFPQAWTAYAQLVLDRSIIEDLSAYGERIDNLLEREEYAKALSNLPWQAWIVRNIAPVDELARMVLNCHDALSASKEDQLGFGRAAIGWSLVDIVSNVHRLGRVVRQDEWMGAVRDCARQISQCVDPTGVRLHASRAAYYLEWHSTEGDEAARDALYRRVLEIPGRRVGRSGSGLPQDISTKARVFADLLRLNAPVALLAPRLEEFCHSLRAEWDTHRAFFARNSHLLTGISELLAGLLEKSVVADLDFTRKALLDLIRIDSSTLRTLGRVLDRHAWQGEWRHLVEEIRCAVGGYRGRGSRPRLCDALALWLDWLALEGRGELDADLGVLADASSLAVYSESHLVANLAAYAVGRYAETVSDDCLGLHHVLCAIRSTAEDPRLPIRHGAAFNAARLKELAPAAQVRALAAELDDVLGRDPYAWVQRQRKYGAALAASERQVLPLANVGRQSTQTPD